MASLLLRIGTSLIPTVYAQSVWRDYYSTFGGAGSGRGFIVDVAVRGANFFLMLITGGCVLAIMWGGIRMATSAGNEEAKEHAKKTVEAAIIGAVLALMAQAIISFTAKFFGILSQ